MIDYQKHVISDNNHERDDVDDKDCALQDINLITNSINLKPNNKKILDRNIQNTNECNDYCDGCGPGREYGYSNSYTNACRNWEGYDYSTYGYVSIPYWINMPSMYTIENESNRNILINDIRYQISLWNSIRMNDGSGTLVDLFEVGINTLTKPYISDTFPVVEIRREDGNYSGVFYPNDLTICINYNVDGTGNRPGRNIDTPMHEVGHLLGLNDLDEDGVPAGTHHVLMGYCRGTTESTLFDAIKYSDIQGVAFLSGAHTNHRFDRYFVHDGLYKHICFYCDTIEATTSPLSGSQQFVYANSCSHEYEEMVSIGNKHWLKCTKCYFILEHYHSFTYSYENYNSSSHIAYCWCGESITVSHTFNNHYCIYCNRHTTEHDYHEPYTWLSLQRHLSSCVCGSTAQQPHVVSGGGNLRYNGGHFYMTCLLCDGDADVGFVYPFIFDNLPSRDYFILSNGVIVVFNDDITSFLHNKRINEHY